MSCYLIAVYFLFDKRVMDNEYDNDNMQIYHKRLHLLTELLVTKCYEAFVRKKRVYNFRSLSVPISRRGLTNSAATESPADSSDTRGMLYLLRMRCDLKLGERPSW